MDRARHDLHRVLIIPAWCHVPSLRNIIIHDVSHQIVNLMKGGSVT